LLTRQIRAATFSELSNRTPQLSSTTRFNNDKGKITKADDIVAVARAAYEAYVAKDRAAIEKLIALDFYFTSPLDNRIDRATYFARCWPNSGTINRFDFINLVPNRDRVFVTYEGRHADGQGFRNTEIVTVRNNQIVDVEVYFG
jgi:hypothetical protein